MPDDPEFGLPDEKQTQSAFEKCDVGPNRDAAPGPDPVASRLRESE
jgi:hypothetical protein